MWDLAVKSFPYIRTSVHLYIFLVLKFLKSNLFFFLLLTTTVFSLYGKSINFDFTYHDDDGVILQKVDFLSHITNIPQLFLTSCYYSDDFKYYRPILNLSFLLETSIFGLNAKIYHSTNIILFILVLYLMYVFLSKLNINRTISKFLILLLSVHPILTSCVVWLPARNDTLLAIFIFLSFIFFADYLASHSKKYFILYVLFWTIALFTKETALLILFLYPIFVVCFDYNFSKKEIYKHVLAFIPILVIYFYLRNISVQSVNVSFYFQNITSCLNNFITGVSTYLYKLLVPCNIPIMLYDISLTINNIILDSLLLMMILFLCYKKILNIKILLFSVIWFVCGLLTTFLLQDYVYLNHRLIVSLFGIVMISVQVIDKLIIKYAEIKKYMIFIFAILFLFCFFNSFILQKKYCNKYEYWFDACLDAPTYHGVYYCISHLYVEQQNYIKAKEFLEKAMKLNGDIYASDLALIHYRQGNMDKAEELYKKSIDIGINKAQCYRNLSVIYLKRDNDFNKAMEYAQLAVQEEPYDDEYKKYLEVLQNQIKNVKD